MIIVFRYRVVRRRVVQLIGCWVGVKYDAGNRNSIYRTLLPILHPSEDLVVC